MDPNVERPWTEGEKLYLLAEILKEAGIPSAILLGIINDAGVEPRWTEIPLPSGRSLRSSQNAFLALRGNALGATPMRPRPLPTAIPGDLAISPNPRKRALPSGSDQSTPGGRALQPRPPAFSSINGQQTSSPYQASSPADDPNQPAKKKRGRPSKAEMELRAAAAAAKGEPYPPPKPAKAAQGIQLPGKMYTAPVAAVAATTGTAGMASPGGPELSPGESSSAKKRRGRPTKEEAHAKRLLLEAAAVAASGEDPVVAGAAAAEEGADEGGAADQAATTAAEAGLEKDVDSSGTLPHSADVSTKI